MTKLEELQQRYDKLYEAYTEKVSLLNDVSAVLNTCDHKLDLTEQVCDQYYERWCSAVHDTEELIKENDDLRELVLELSEDKDELLEANKELVDALDKIYQFIGEKIGC